MLTSHLDELHALAKGLLEYETLSADEIRRIIKGERIVREPSATPAPVDEGRPVEIGVQERRPGGDDPGRQRQRREPPERPELAPLGQISLPARAHGQGHDEHFRERARAALA